jgi:hypothetical protein
VSDLGEGIRHAGYFDSEEINIEYFHYLSDRGDLWKNLKC